MNQVLLLLRQAGESETINMLLMMKTFKNLQFLMDCLQVPLSYP